MPLTSLRLIAVVFISVISAAQEARRLPSIPEIFAPGGVTGREPETVKWSPDGTRVSYVLRDDSGEHGGEAGNERPRLGLTGEAGRCGGEQREAGAEGGEGAAGDPGLVRSREDGEDEHEAEGEPGGDRGEHDEAYVALRGGLLSGRGAAAGGNGLGGHFDSSLDIGQ